MPTFTLSGGNANTGFEMHYWGAFAILGMLTDDVTTASGNTSQVTFNNGNILVANGTFVLGPDSFPTSGTVTSFVYTWFLNGVAETITVTGFSLNVATLYTWANNDDYESAENFLLGGDDTITGSAAPETFRGYKGNDTINAGGGDDDIYVYIGDGHDIIDGGSGYDYLKLEFGSLFFPSPAINYTFDIPAMGTNTGVTLADGTFIRNVEAAHITGAGGADTFIVGAAVDFNLGAWLDGHDGVDTLRADFSGANIGIGNIPFSPGSSGMFLGYTIMNIERWELYGSSVSDTLRGALINDVLHGGGGNDTLEGNAGNDVLNGGAGIDGATLNSQRSDGSWHRNPDGSWTVTALNDGTDTVTNVEFLNFAVGGNVFLDRAYSTFSGDGTSDVFMRHSSGTMGAWFVGASGVTGAAGMGSLDPDWAIEGVADFNGDGRDDILMRHSNGNMGSWFMNGAAATGGASFGNVDASWDIAGLGDFNCDGFDDILMWHANGSLGVYFINNGAVSSAAGLGGINPAQWDFEGIGDFNGDGRDDILWRNDSGNLGIYFMDGANITGAGAGGIGLNWSIEGVGDFNGDGRDDILMRDTSGNVGAWFMNGASAIGAVGLGNVGSDFSVAAIGDYNGDGRDDVLWWHDSGGLGAWFMNGASVSAVGYGSVSHDWVINPGG